MTPAKTFYLKALVALLLVLFSAAFYLPGLSGGYWLDDFSNLPSIFREVRSDGILYAIGNGHAGPLGRPLSLLSFALQAGSWPVARDFIGVNISIHALNTLCVFLLSLLLLKDGPYQWKGRKACFLALLIAVLWSCAPIQVSSVLYVVQRMTLLSSSFVLIALLFFIWGRSFLRSGKTALGLIFICLLTPVSGTLGLYSKETAFLLIVYLLVLDYWLEAASPVENRVYIMVVRWPLHAVFLGFIAYLISMFFKPDAFASRDFNVYERMLSQSVIVWEYVRQIILPRVSELGLYHESYPVSRGFFAPVVTMVAVLAWLAVFLVFAFFIRRRFYIGVFLISWFVGGHLLESTSLSLELYFEHRNYLPSYAIWFALSIGAYKLCVEMFSRAKRPLIIILGLCYLTILLGQGNYLVRLWGEPVRLAYLYTTERPDSIRAREMMLYLYQTHGEIESVKSELSRLDSDFPDNLTVKLLQLEYSCLYPDVIRYSFEPGLYTLAKKPRVSMGAIGATSDLFERASSKEGCSGYDIPMLLKLLDLLLENRAYVKNKGNILSLKSEIILYMGDLEAALAAMQKVESPNYQMSIRKVQLLGALGRVGAAIDLLDDIKSNRKYSLQTRGQSEYLLRLESELRNELKVD